MRLHRHLLALGQQHCLQYKYVTLLHFRTLSHAAQQLDTNPASDGLRGSSSKPLSHAAQQLEHGCGVSLGGEVGRARAGGIGHLRQVGRPHEQRLCDLPQIATQLDLSLSSSMPDGGLWQQSAGDRVW